MQIVFVLPSSDAPITSRIAEQFCKTAVRYSSRIASPKKPYQILTRIIDTTDGLFSVGSCIILYLLFLYKVFLVAVFVGIFLHQATDMLMVPSFKKIN